VSYNIQYRQTGTSSWSTTSSSVNSVTISGLTSGTTYEFQVEVACTSGTSGFSGSSDFTTLTITCPLPSGLGVTTITSTSAILNWAAVTGAVSYSIQYRPAGTSGWNYTLSTTTSATITGLIPATAYEFEVQSDCSVSDSSGYTISTVFTTSGSAGLPITSLTENSFVIYPNPVTEQTQVSYSLNIAEKVSIGIYNIVGQEVMGVIKNELQIPGAHSYNIVIKTPGVYFIKLTAGKSSMIKKVVKL